MSFVPKTDGSWRMCIDFRPLNNVTSKDAQSLPNITELLDEFQGKNVLTIIDLFSGYYQIPLSEESKEKTAFWTKYGLFQYKVMPFGLCNAPATFQRTMEMILNPLLHDCVSVYIDDIIISSKNYDEHEEHLRKVLLLLREANLKVNKKKSCLFQEEIKVLGFLVNKDGIRIDPERIKVISDITTPRNVKELQRILGIVGYCRRFIPNFAKHALPLTDLLKKNRSWKWTTAEQLALDELKAQFVEHSFLAYPNFKDEFSVYTDASGSAIGGCILQQGKLVAAASRKLSPAEMNYSTTEKEALAIIWTLKQFRHYLLGSKFKLSTDHKCLTSMTQLKDPTGRIVRWLTVLADFDMRIAYVPGKENCLADSLSRPIPLEEEVGIYLVEVTNGDSLRTLFEVLKGETNIAELPKNVRKSVTRKMKRFYLRDGVLFKRNYVGNDTKVVWEQEERNEILKKFHSFGHPPVRRMFEEITDQFHWEGLYKDCERTVAGCAACLQLGSPKYVPALRQFESSGLFEVFHVDFIGPLPTTRAGNCHALVAVDRCSRFLIACAMKETNSAVVQNFIAREIILRYGLPRKIVSDRGRAFISADTEKFLKDNEIEHGRTTAYHPEANGQVERYNRTLKDMLGKLCRDKRKDWDVLLPLAVFFINSRKNGSIGMSPFEFLYGIPVHYFNEKKKELITNDFETLMSRLREIQSIEKLREAANDKKNSIVHRKEKTKQLDIQVNDRVLLWEPALRVTSFGQTKWTGPYVVKGIDGYGNYYLHGRSNVIDRTPINRQRLRKIPSSSGRTSGMEGELLMQRKYSGENDPMCQSASASASIGNDCIPATSIKE